jgi:hypothetical protein
MMEWWKSTDSFTKEKKFPTYADAVGFDPTLELREFNPVENAEGELSLIAHRIGMMRLRDSMTGKPKPKVVSFVVKVGNKFYESFKNHEDALNKAGMSKQTAQEGTDYEALFRTTDARYIGRDQA